VLFSLPGVYGGTVGTKIKMYGKFIKYFTVLKFAIPCFLSLIPNFFKISNVINLKINKPGIATASGTFCTKIPTKKRDKMLKLILPSKVTKFFSQLTICFIGKNDVSYKNSLQPGKAGVNCNYGKKPKVRGVAMNPVDHPNGGRTKSCSPEKSP